MQTRQTKYAAYATVYIIVILAVLVVANFLPDIWGAGYMETFMDWKLIYRTAEEMEGLCANIEEGYGRRIAEGL